MSAAAPRPPSAGSGASGSGASGPGGSTSGGSQPGFGSPAGCASRLYPAGAGGSAPVRRPRTPEGLFLRAAATSRRADTVPGGAARDLFARAFALVVRRRFGPETPLAAITGSVAACARRHTELTVPVREAEMLIREALGDTVPTAGIEAAHRIIVHVLLFAALVDELALTDDELDELIAGAEAGAGEAGGG